jgi:hypothetical protein
MKRKREFEPFLSNKKLKLDNNENVYTNKKRKYESDESQKFNNKKICLFDISKCNDKIENYTRYRRDILIYT